MNLIIDPVLKAKLKPLEGLLKVSNLVELSAVREGEVALELADKGYVFKEVSELSIEYWTNLCYVLGNKKGEVFNPETQPRMSTRLPGEGIGLKR